MRLEADVCMTRAPAMPWDSVAVGAERITQDCPAFRRGWVHSHRADQWTFSAAELLAGGASSDWPLLYAVFLY
jgi:hypothetical protein